MRRSRKRRGRGQRCGQLAAIEMLGVGVAFVALPHVVKNPALAAGLHSLAMVRWMLVIAGGALRKV